MRAPGREGHDFHKLIRSTAYDDGGATGQAALPCIPERLLSATTVATFSIGESGMMTKEFFANLLELALAFQQSSLPRRRSGQPVWNQQS